MAFDKTPSTWLGSGYSYGTNQILLNTAGHATPLLTELSAADANASTGDIRKIIFALLEMIYAKNEAIAAASRPSAMSVSRQISTPTSGVIRNTYKVSFDTVVSAQEVAAEDAPTVTAISPLTGGTAGGTAVTITGTGFSANATVAIGGEACTSVVVVSATSITCSTAAHAGGAVDVVVTNADTQAGTLSGGFTYA